MTGLLLALALTGAAGARLGDSPALALAATFAIGSLLGTPAG